MIGHILMKENHEGLHRQLLPMRLTLVARRINCNYWCTRYPVHKPDRKRKIAMIKASIAMETKSAWTTSHTMDEVLCDFFSETSVYTVGRARIIRSTAFCYIARGDVTHVSMVG